MSALLLVPTPLRAARAARRLCDAEGGVLLGARVATPEALLPALLAAAGDPRTLLSPLGVRLLALESAGPPGAPLAGADPAGGLARAWAAALAELRRGEVTADVAAAAAASLGGRPGERLAALAAALRRYQQRLEDLGALDRPAALRAAASAVRRGAAAEATGSLDLLAVDGFGAPSAGEWDLFAALAGRARRAHVRAPALAERPDLFAGAEPLLRRAEGLGAGSAETSLSLGRAEAREPRLGRMLLALAGGPGGGPAGDGGRLRLAAGAGEEGEAEVAARLAAGLLEGGLAPEDVLLFAPATARAAPLLARAFADRGVPLACGAAGSLAEAPPVRAVRAALAAGAAPGEEAAAAATSYLDPGRSGELLRPFGRPATAAAQAAALAALLSAGGVRRRAARGEAARAARDLAALDRLEETAEELARARALLGRGADRLEPAAWLSSLDCALAAAAAPPAAEPASGAVELWPLAEAPGLEARAAIVLSCARGRFPAPPPPEPLLREPERAAVNRLLRRGALATASARRADALLAAAGALAAGRELVACTWAASGPEGPGETPAPLAAEAAALAGSDPEPPAAGPALGEARAAAEAVQAVARAARAGRAGAALRALHAASPDLAERGADAAARGAAEAERAAAVAARSASAYSGAVAPAALRGALPAEWTPSQLETYARCPFRLLAGMALGLRDPPATGLDIDPRDEGSLTHAVLERFHRRRLQAGAGPLRGDPAERQALRDAAGDLFRRFEAEGRVGEPAAWAARRGAVLARLERVVAAEAREGDGLAPALVEHRFEGSTALVLADRGEEVRLRGRIDRVDAAPDRLRVVDYKNSADERGHRERIDPEALGATEFQLPAYLLAAAQALPGRRGLEASWLLLKTARRLDLALDAGDGFLAVDEAGRARARAAGGRTFADAATGLVRRIRAGDFPVASRSCAGCALGAVCRFETAAEAEG